MKKNSRLIIKILSSFALISLVGAALVPFAAKADWGGGCNVYGCWSAGGGCNVYGCWRLGGGCNVYGCW